MAIDIAGEADPPAGQDDEIVADALQLGDDVGGEQHRGATVDASVEHRREELPPGERVQVGQRLVQ